MSDENRAVGTAAVPSPQLPSLTGLRFAAASGVVATHAAHVLGKDSFLAQVVAPGYIGVQFFFVLSGFVLVWSSSEVVGWREFLVRRFARIYPLYIVAWLVTAAGILAVDADELNILGFLLGVVLLQAWVPDVDIFQAVNTPGWSLSAEAFFYLAFPLLVLRVRVVAKYVSPLIFAVVGLGAAYSISPWYSVWFAYYSPIWGLVYFIIGMCLANAFRNGRFAGVDLTVASVGFVCLFLGVAICLPGAEKGLVEALLLVPTVGVILGAANRDLQGGGGVWSRGRVVRLGVWSYAVYLVHWPLLGVLEIAVGRGLGNAELFVVLFIFLAVVTAVAAMAHVLVEAPAERYLRRRFLGRVC